jgi:hypothetical protein
LFVPVVAAAQSHPAMTDEEIIKIAVSAGPASIASEAAIVNVEHDGKVRVVREGKNGWTCLPGHGDPSNLDPMCGDKNAMEWAEALLTKKDPPPNKVGFMYMLRGDEGASNTDPFATKETADNNWVKTGPHVMIVGSGAKMLEGYPRDAKPDATKPYVMWGNTPYEHVMLPVAPK